jgi:hypothetical protein
VRTGNEVIVTKGPRAGQEGVIEFGCFADKSFSVRFTNDETAIVSKECLKLKPKPKDEGWDYSGGIKFLP